MKQRKMKAQREKTMNNKIKYLLITVMLLIAVCFVASCSQWDTPYDTLGEGGYNVSVRFDPNGGSFSGAENVNVVDVFNLDNQKTNANGNKVIPLVAPDDKSRPTQYVASKQGYTLVGWYTSRELRVDKDGNALDDYGELVSVSGRNQGYVYSGKWDFATSTVEVDPNNKYNGEESVLTLYAAWAPHFNINFYEDKGNGEYELIGNKISSSLEISTWDGAKMKEKDLPKLDGKTFKEASITSDFATLLSGTVTGHDLGMYDYETGTLKNGNNLNVYIRYNEGRWFKITNATQIRDNSYLDGCYIIENDLDFTGVTWKSLLSNDTFKGKIIGNGHKLSNITINQEDVNVMRGGLFGGIDAVAVIENVTFENVTYNMNKGSLKAGASFGLLAGVISSGATLTNVEISGKFNISSEIYPNSDYTVGVISGNVIETVIDTSNVECTVTGDQEKLSIEVENGQITLNFVE